MSGDKKTSKATSIDRAIEMLLVQAVNDRASHIHIEPREDGVHARYRIDGILHKAVILPLSIHVALLSLIKEMAKDGQFSTKVGDKAIGFRVGTAETVHGEIAVFRVLDEPLTALQISETGMSFTLLEFYKRVLQSAFGMVIISGPTGSGKTTTLYASVGQLDAKQQNIMTVEDPVEYHLAGINQIQVSPPEITFARDLRAIMRLDPDIILVGEIRDGETANVAVQAALSGRLVLASISAYDVVGAVVRMADIGVKPSLFSSAVIAVLSQRLVCKVCPNCRILEAAPPAEVVRNVHTL